MVLYYVRYYLNFVSLGNATPNLLDLHREIISQYAVRWRALGTQLNISTNSLDIIEANNSHHREHVRTCCRDMLIKWIETDTEATWNKLHKAIAHLPPLSDDKSSKCKNVIVVRDLYSFLFYLLVCYYT